LGVEDPAVGAAAVSAEVAEASGVLVEVPRAAVERAEAGRNQHTAAQWPQPERNSLCSSSLQSLDTKSAEISVTSVLRLFFEDTEA
jgi:hypothetical protein